MKKFVQAIVLGSFLLIPAITYADSAPGDIIVTLGGNLSDTQKQTVLIEMKAPENAQTITVSNDEEKKYLGGVIPQAQIGTKSISSSMITIGEKDSGLSVESHNINWVTNDMYTNALITAGVKDAKIYITAPFEVSGTAALTGLMKAYELSSDKVIPDEVKKVANEEMVQTAELGQTIGNDKAVALLAGIKEKMAVHAPQSDAELTTMITEVAKQNGITLSDSDVNNLVSLFNKMKDVNIDWSQVTSQIDLVKGKLQAFINSEEGQSFFQKIKEILSGIWNSIFGK